jgi:eukaryotic-like serine/threonine-protein kinase
VSYRGLYGELRPGPARKTDARSAWYAADSVAKRKGSESSAPAAPPPENSLIGRVLDSRYRIDEQLGAGGVGAVYCGTQIALGRPVAIKILHEGVHPSFTQRFEREARALASLRHPNIVAVTDYGVCDDTPFLVMELLEGETLAYRLMKGRMQPEQVLVVARQLLGALAFVHEQGLVHRDLKPGNVFLEKLPGGEERLKLLDFGLAKFVQAEANPDEPAVTRAGDIVGTPAYISPEQIAGDTIDPRVDTYAMGVILYQMLSGRVPFEGEPIEQLKSHLVAPVPPLREKHPGLLPKPELEAFLQRAMAKARDTRFQNAAEMLAALEAIAQPWVVESDTKVQALASTMLSTPPPDGSLEPPTELRTPGPTDTQLMRHARTYGAVAALMISFAATAFAVALLTTPREPDGKQPPASSAETDIGGEQDMAQEPLAPVVTAGDDGRHSSARVGAGAMPPGEPEPSEGEADEPVPGEPRAGEPVPGEPVPSEATPLAQAPDVEPADAPSAEAETAPVAVTKPAPAPVAAAAPAIVEPGRPAARNPWARAVPKELRNLRNAAVAGERGNERSLAYLRKYNRANESDARGHLLLAHFYMNRSWRADVLKQYEIAYGVDPTVRGAPEMLRDLLKLVAHGAEANGAARLVRNAYGREALPAIERAIGALTKHDVALSRMTALRNSIAGS